MSDESDSIEDQNASALQRIESSRNRILALLSTLKKDVGPIDRTPRVAIPEEITHLLDQSGPYQPDRLSDMVDTVVESYFEVPEDSEPLLADIARLDRILIAREKSAALTFKRLKDESKPAPVTATQPPERPKVEPTSSKSSRVPTARPQRSLGPLADPQDLAELAAIDRRLNILNPRPSSAACRSLKAIDKDLDNLHALPVTARPTPRDVSAIQLPEVYAITAPDAFIEINQLLDEAEAELANYPETENVETDSIKDDLAELSSTVNEVLNAIG